MHSDSQQFVSHASNNVNAAYDPTYDVMGRVTGIRYCLPSDCNYDLNVTAAYDLGGNLTQLTYPDGETVTYTSDGDGRPLSAADGSNGINYATAASYSSGGALAGFISGKTGSFAGITNSFTYNNRLQPVNMSATPPGGGGNAPPITVAGSGFETPAVGAGNFQYDPSGSSWSFAGQAGVSGSGSGFTAGNPAAPEGSQVAFLQNGSASVISQSLSGFQTGVSYTVNFQAAQRNNCCGYGGQDFDVYLDSTLLGTFSPGSSGYSAFSTPAFTTTAGSHTLKFVGRDSSGGDNTAFIDAVQVTVGTSGSSSPIFSLNYDFHVGNANNGNVWGITNNKDNSRNQSFTYDALNRLLSAQNAGRDCSKTLANGKTEYWGNSYGYDAWGNLLAKTVTKCAAESLSVSVAANNQLLGGYSYDAAGNMTHDATYGHNYVYDAQSRILQVDNGAASYVYDADGERVRKNVSGGPSTDYLYFNGQILAEKNASTGAWTNYVFFAGERVARRDPGNVVSYYFSDHLKTTDIVTDAQGVIKNESDFYPWGGELQFANNDSNHYKFTGKERDAETGLDYFGARYYANGLGRFVTPDLPFIDQHPADPQSWNLYTYVRNNPLRFADPTGNSVAGCANIATCQEMEGDGTNNAAGSVSEAADPAPDPDALEEEAERGDPSNSESSNKKSNAMGAAKEIVGELNDLTPAGQTMRQIGALNSFFGLPNPFEAANPQEAKAMKYTAVAIFFLPIFGEDAAAKKGEVLAQRAESKGIYYLYQKLSAIGEHLKYGITKNPGTRYTAQQMAGGRLKILTNGSKAEMLRLERSLHSTLPIGREERQEFYVIQQILKGLKPPPY